MPSEDSRMRILWVVPKFPLGPPDGARHATCSLVRALILKGVRIDMICLVPKGEEADGESAKKNLGVSSCLVISRSASKIWPLPGPRTPFTFRSFAAPRVRQELRDAIENLLQGEIPAAKTFLLFDGLHGFAALGESTLQSFSDRCAGIAYRAHNHETSLWEQCAEKERRPWLRWFLRYQATLVKNFERRISQSADLIAPVSGEDRERFRALAPQTQGAVIPIGIDFSSEGDLRPAPPSKTLALLFLGRLDWLPNRNGLQWFMEEVWKKLLEIRRDVTLTVAGTGDGRWFQKYIDQPGITYLGRVERVQPAYESCVLSIAPIFQGSGTRVKILESSRHARPVVTTALGAEGLGLTPGRSFYQAENRAAWLDLLSTVTIEDCRETGLKALREVRERFDSEAVAQRLIDALNIARR